MAENNRGRDLGENEKVGQNRLERAKIFREKVADGFGGMNYEQQRAPFKGNVGERQSDIKGRNSERE